MRLDFTSALYLGLSHPHGALAPWGDLTLGKPTALDEPAEALRTAAGLARLQGCAAAVLGTSSLHLFWDFLGGLKDDAVVLYLDAGAYPIARWGGERAAAQGVAVREFRHHDPDDLRRRLRAEGRTRRRPLLIADGFCPAFGQPAPLADYVDCLRPYGGRLLVDDTQALGLLGATPSRAQPWGRGGGGCLRWWGIDGPDLLVIASLAKGFGAPLAALSGSREELARFAARSQTRRHCSPPSMAAIHALRRALAINQAEGDARRRHLQALLKDFRQGLALLGLNATGGGFPVQTLAAGFDAAKWHARLLEQGVECLLQPGRHGRPERLGFLLTAAHRRADIDEALAALALGM